MTKLELATTIAILLFAMLAPLGLMAEMLVIEDPIITDGPLERINTISVDEEKKFCLEKLLEGGLGDICLQEVDQALVFGFMTDLTLGLQCCQNVLAVDMANNKCFKLLFDRPGMIEIDVVSLIEFCAQMILEYIAPEPTSQ